MPTNEFFEGRSWVFEGDELPGEDVEITVKAVEPFDGELVEESAVVLVTSVDAAATFPITAAPL